MKKARSTDFFFLGGVQFVILGILSHKNTSIFHHFSKIAKSL